MAQQKPQSRGWSRGRILGLGIGVTVLILCLVACGGSMLTSSGTAPSANEQVSVGDVRSGESTVAQGATATPTESGASAATAGPSGGGAYVGADAEMAEMPAPSPASPAARPPATPSRTSARGRRGGAEGETLAAAPAEEAPMDGFGASTTVTVETVVERSEIVLRQQQVPRVLLTAASVGDNDRRDNYIEYLARHRGEAARLGLDMTRRTRFRVLDRNGDPVNDAELRLQGRAQGQAIGRTHADGIFDFYPNVAANRLSGRVPVEIRAGAVRAETVVDFPAHGDGDEVIFRLDAVASAPQALDLAFVIDVTGSMEDELRYVNAEVVDIVDRIRSARSEVRVRVGATLYRDRSDREVVQRIAFTDDVQGFSRALSSIHASGGGDYPEDLNSGLDEALSRMRWSRGNAARVLILIADAPPKRYHQATFTYHDAMRDAGARGIRILPVAASGADRTVEYLFRAMGAYTSTPYVYLTDDSGVGNPHMEADTDRVAVEYFNHLLTRLVLSDLSGEGMHEPGLFGGQQ